MNDQTGFYIVTNFKRIALSAAILGGLAATQGVSAAIIDITPGTSLAVEDFCAGAGGGGTAPNTYRAGIFGFTCYNGVDMPDPAAAHMAATNLFDGTSITIGSATIPIGGGLQEVQGSLNISSLNASQSAGSLSYYVELMPGGDVDADPELFLDRIDLTQETQITNRDNVQTRKQITGQVTDLVPSPTFTADLIATGAGDDSAACGECRRFAVTDTFDENRPGGTGFPGTLRSMTNVYTTVTDVPVPVPAPLALVAFGLFGMGIVSRRRRG
jgi:hypothetical protein